MSINTTNENTGFSKDMEGCPIREVWMLYLSTCCAWQYHYEDMDGKTSSSKNCDDTDADVDHYFLPGGILDTPSHEEDMIGGSLLDEIGGMRNVARLVPHKQMSVIGRTGPEAGIGIGSSGSQRRSKPTSVAIEDSARLSVEGTNPMAKEFTPAARPLPSGSAISSQPGGPLSRTSFNTPSDPRQRPSSRVFSAAVGSEVKKPATEFTVQRALGNSGQPSRYQQDWVTRAISFPGHPSPSLATNHRLANPSQGRLPPPPGLPPRGTIPQRSGTVYRVQGEEMGHLFGPSHRRERGTSNSLKPVQSTAGTSLPRETSKPAMYGYHSVTRQQQRTRSQGSLLREVQLDESNGITVAKTVGSEGRDGVSDRPLRRSHRVDNENTTKGPTRTRIPRDSVNVRGETRVQMQTISEGHEDAIKDSPGRHVDDVEHNAAGKHSKAFSEGSALTPVQTDTGHRDVSQHRVSPKPSPSSKDEASFLSDVLDSDELSPRLSAGRWPSSNLDRAPQQVQKDSSGFGNVGKPKSKKKEERYANRSGPKHMLGAPTKELSKGKLMTRSSFARSLTAFAGASVRNLSFGVSSAAVQTIAWSFARLRLIGLVSLAASMGASCLTVVLTMMSWLLMFWLRIHSVALKEATGSIHVSVCFLFPYFFHYLTSLVDEWTPHWLPVCLWYSFLMQMFSTSNHLHKTSAASSVVPALRALLPVAFLCEVPSGRSYLLALEGSELLLLSFTLAAVRLRCLLSPIFLFSWSSQVIAIATFGSCASLQYCQLLISLASLHAVSIVDVTLNSKFYHARYRAGMSLTNGFRIIPPPQLTLLR